MSETECSTSKLFLSIHELPKIFHDLTPVPQEETPGAAARIDYSDDFITAYDYQRAVWRVNEKNTDRALQLTAVCLRLNPANYTVWHFRRLCLEEIYGPSGDYSFIKDEMALAALLGGENPKNYQIWYHRRALLERLAVENTTNDTEIQQFYRDELDYIATVVREDGKNYHAWSHRQWVVITISNLVVRDEIWKQELDFCDSLVEIDIRNNSAWNHRWFVTHRGLHMRSHSPADATIEADYALSKAELDPFNESSWRYLIAVIKEQVFALQDADMVTTLLCNYYDKAVQVEKQFFEQNSDLGISCSPNLTAALIDLLEWRGDSPSVKQAIKLSNSLANEHDMIRQKYWKLRISKLEKKL